MELYKPHKPQTKFCCDYPCKIFATTISVNLAGNLLCNANLWDDPKSKHLCTCHNILGFDLLHCHAIFSSRSLNKKNIFLNIFKFSFAFLNFCYFQSICCSYFIYLPAWKLHLQNNLEYAKFFAETTCPIMCNSAIRHNYSFVIFFINYMKFNLCLF